MVRRHWFCTSNAKSMVVKIVHPGGHIELHDSPVLAAEILHRNPKCCVTYPHVFRLPWAIVAPDTMLMLGDKFYVVPINTVRKLQRLSLRQYPSMLSTSASRNKFLKDGWCFFKDGCLARLITGSNIKDKPNDWSESSNPSSSSGSSDTRELYPWRKGSKVSTKRCSLIDWQPRLESITEEKSDSNL